MGRAALSDLRCPTCSSPVTQFHQFNAPPAPEDIAAAWVGLGRPEEMDLSNELFVHQAQLVWPDPDSLAEDDPIRALLNKRVRHHEGGGLWMRPATVEYARMECAGCHRKMSRPVPADAVPVGHVLRCPQCEIKNQEQPNPTHLREFMGWLTTREGTLLLGAGHDAAPAVDAVDEYLRVKGGDER